MSEINTAIAVWASLMTLAEFITGYLYWTRGRPFVTVSARVRRETHDWGGDVKPSKVTVTGIASPCNQPTTIRVRIVVSKSGRRCIPVRGVWGSALHNKLYKR